MSEIQENAVQENAVHEGTVPASEVIVVLDYPSSTEALTLVDRVGPSGDFYKVGLELFTTAGPTILRELRDRGKRIFLDLKLHDIPNTVARAVEAALRHDVELLTVHASGGAPMLSAAAEAAGGNLRLLGVTVLTSHSESTLGTSWGRSVASVHEEVLRLATLAHDCGLDGLVSSPLECRAIKERFGSGMKVATPGIRLAGGEAHDQVRIATPASAARSGSDYLIIGRAVTQADDPVDALRRVHAELDSVAGERAP